MKALSAIAAVALLTALATTRAGAHHSVFAEFDINGSVTIEGVTVSYTHLTLPTS